MIRGSFSLPTRHRLDKTLLFPNLGRILRAKKGSKLSRFFRHIFEHKKIRKVLGTNLAILVIATSFAPAKAAVSGNFEENIIAEAPYVFPVEKSVQYPVRTVKISQGYSPFHSGIDFDGVTGDEVKPVMAGRVEAVGHSKLGYGNVVLINHGGRRVSLYAHLSKISVAESQEVSTLTKIGELGATGRSLGDHLHLEVLDHGHPINPLTVLPEVQ